MTHGIVHFGNLSIIVLDPDRTFREAVHERLVAAGVRKEGICLLSRASDAVSRIFGHMKGPEVNFLLSAWSLGPGGGAEQVIKSVRHLPESPNPRLPVVVRAAAPDSSTFKRIWEMGIDEILIGATADPAKSVTTIGGLLANPKVWIDSPAYVGPDRRREPRPGVPRFVPNHEATRGSPR